MLVGAVMTVLIGIPLLVLRGRSATRRTTGRGLLIGAEALLLLPLLGVVASRWTTAPAGPT